MHTICPRSSYPFYIATYYIEWVTTSRTCSTFVSASEQQQKSTRFSKNIPMKGMEKISCFFPVLANKSEAG